MLQKIPYDKKLHFIAGFVITIIFALIFLNPLYGFAAGVLAGICKEIYDWLDYGRFDIFDMFTTWFGSAIGYGITILLSKL